VSGMTAKARCDAPLTVADLLMNPAVSFALKTVILSWETRDVVDAAADARLLAEVFMRRADEAVSWIW